MYEKILGLFSNIEKSELSVYTSIAAALISGTVILLGYYIRKQYPVDMWGYTDVNSILITLLLIVLCYILKPDLSLKVPNSVIPLLLISALLTAFIVALRIFSVTHTNNIAYTSSFKILTHIVIFLGSAYILKENFSLRGVIGILLGLISVYLIFNEKQK